VSVSERPPPGDGERPGFKVRESPATAGLIAAFVAVWLATWFDTDRVIFSLFAKVNEAILQGQVWRLFTASFLHAGLLHLWFNSTALAAIGPSIERAYGRVQYLAAFLVGGAVGMAASVLFVPAPSVGASAGVFALLGVLLAHAVRSKGTMTPPARKALIARVLTVVALNVAVGLLANFIDNAAHIGGLVGGFVLGFALRERPPPRDPSTRAGAGPGAPALPPPATPRAARRPGRSYFGWAGQRWKMVVLFLGLVPVFLSMFGDTDPLPAELVPLLVLIGFGVAATARCPRCKVRVFWWCVSKLPAGRALKTAFESESCPVCRYPDDALESWAAAAGRPRSR
jgi:membrane associated rhomboid family serine protease